MPDGMSITTRLRRPPFCPNPRCDSHGDPGAWRFVKKGFYVRNRAPRRIQKYRCSHCGRNFSSQTFSTTYWLRRPDLLAPTFHRLVSCSGFRQIAREFGVSHTTIRRLSDRLGHSDILATLIYYWFGHFSCLFLVLFSSIRVRACLPDIQISSFLIVLYYKFSVEDTFSINFPRRLT